MASTITRDTWTNDTGSAATPAGDGTIINNNALQNNIYARIDELFAGAGSYTTLTLGGALAVSGSLTGSGRATVSAADGVSDNNYVAMFTNLEATADRNFGLFVKGGSSSVDSSFFVRNIANTDLLRLTGLGIFSVNGFGTHAFTSGGTGSNELAVKNTTAGTGNTAFFGAYNDAGLSGYLQVFSSTFTTSGPSVANGALLGAGRAGGISIAATDAAGDIRFYTGGSTLRWGINDAGDLTFGASSHIADSSGTPTIASGFGAGGSIAGTDYAVRVTMVGAANTTGTVNFGHTWTSAPVCVAMVSNTTALPLTVSASTTQLQLDYSSIGVAVFDVLCRGY